MYEISDDVITDVLAKTCNDKTPGPDHIVGYCYKNLRFYVPFLRPLYSLCLDGKIPLPDWLCHAFTWLIPKCADTHFPNNYRPISCQNVMLKFYGRCISFFLSDHCIKNGVITTEQSAGKRDVWGCNELLLINKMIQEEVIATQ